MQAVNALRNNVVSISSMQRLFIRWVKILRKLVDDVLNSLVVKVMRYQSASTPDGPDSRFIKVVAFEIKDSSIWL